MLDGSGLTNKLSLASSDGQEAYAVCAIASTLSGVQHTKP